MSNNLLIIVIICMNTLHQTLISSFICYLQCHEALPVCLYINMHIICYLNRHSHTVEHVLDDFGRHICFGDVQHMFGFQVLLIHHLEKYKLKMSKSSQEKPSHTYMQMHLTIDAFALPLKKIFLPQDFLTELLNCQPYIRLRTLLIQRQNRSCKRFVFVAHGSD